MRLRVSEATGSYPPRHRPVLPGVLVRASLACRRSWLYWRHLAVCGGTPHRRVWSGQTRHRRLAQPPARSI